MTKDRKARRSAQMGLVAWANLVGSMVQTMRDCGVETGAIRTFLDNLDEANGLTLDPPAWEFAVHVTALFRAMLPSND